MANGIQILPTLDRFAGLRAGAQNLVGGLIQQGQQRRQLADQNLLLQQIQNAQAGGKPDLTGFQTPQGAQVAAQFLAQQPQAAADLALTRAKTLAAGAPAAGFNETSSKKNQ